MQSTSKNHVIIQDIGNAARYIHDGLRLEIRRPASTGQLLPQRSHIPVTAQSSRVILPNRSHHTELTKAWLVGLGRSPLGLDAQIEKVADYPAIIGYGVNVPSGLLVDEKVVPVGRVPTQPRSASSWRSVSRGY